MEKRTRANIRALNEIIKRACPEIVDDFCQWIEENISTMEKLSSADKGFVVLDPHQRPIIDAIFNSDIREITIIGPQQTGKSFPWQVALAALAAISGVVAYVVYESDDKAKKVNADVITPLFKSHPKLKKYLEASNSYTKDAFHFPNTVAYYSGSGQEISSFEVEFAVASELDRWVGDIKRMDKTLDTLKHRIRRYEKIGKSKFIKESSPDTAAHPSWRSFKKSNQGYYHVACLHCKGLIPSYCIDGIFYEGEFLGGMCYELDDFNNIIPDSVYYECPHCNKALQESDAPEMNRLGEYVYKNSAQKSHIGFQFGALVGYRSITWASIAEALHVAGSTNDIAAHQNLDNAYKGRPYKRREKTAKRLDVLLEHRYNKNEYNPEDISAVFFAADTQKDSWYYVVRGIDKYMNTHLLDKGQVFTADELLNRYDAEYEGMIPSLGIIDQGGGQGRSREVQELVQADESGTLFSYKGGRYQNTDNWHVSKNDETLILCNANHYKAELLSLIYDQQNRDNHYWFLPEGNLDRIYLNHIMAPRPPKGKPDSEYILWKSGEKDNLKDDYFDAEKMLRVVIDMACSTDEDGDPKVLHPDQWRHDMPFIQFA